MSTRPASPSRSSRRRSRATRSRSPSARSPSAPRDFSVSGGILTITRTGLTAGATVTVGYTAGLETETKNESYSYVPSQGVQSIILATTPIAGQAVTVTIGGVVLQAGVDFTVSGDTLELHTTRTGVQAGDTVEVSYTGPMLHGRAETVYVADPANAGQYVNALYEDDTHPVVTLGNEPILYVGGEQAYYTTTDPVQHAQTEGRITVHATSGALTMTLGGTASNGEVWSIDLTGSDVAYGDGIVVSYTVQASDLAAADPIASIASRLAPLITATGLYNASSAGDRLTIAPHGSSLYTASLATTGSGTATCSSGAAEPCTPAGGAAGDFLYTGIASVSLSLGSGDDLVTVVTTNTASTSVSTGAGDDRVAVRDIEGSTTVSTGGGDDTIYVGTEAGLWHTTQAPTVTADANGDKFLNILGDANSIRAVLSIDGGAGDDTVAVDDTRDGAPNMGILSSTQIMGIFGTGGLVDYSGLESLSVFLGDGGNTFTIVSTHAGTTFVSTGAGSDAIFVDTIAGPTTVDAGAGNDVFEAGSGTSPGVSDPIPTSDLDGILNGLLTLTGGTGANELHAYDSDDCPSLASCLPNSGVLTSTTLTGLGMTLGISYSGIQTLDIELSEGSGTIQNHFTVASTPTGSVLTVHGGDGPAGTVNEVNDVIDVTTIGGTATIFGSNGNDILRANYDSHDLQTFANGLAGLLVLDGGRGSDEYDIGLSGQPGPTGSPLTTIDVEDNSPGDTGVNQLFIYGTDQPDYFLFRANQLVNPATAMVAAFRVLPDGSPDLSGVMERVNYDGFINGGLQVYGRDGNDTFVMDDNLAPTTLFGGNGDDTFQIGQVYASPRDGTNPQNGLAPADFYATTPTTQGFLSNGISATTTIFGGAGNDSFTVYHNLAELFLFGQEDDDTFLVRSFVKVNPNDPKAPFTNINGGQGADFISYTVDSPVRIDGGDGLDTLVVLGTEFGDDFVVTDKGIFGAGLYVTYTGVEKVVVDGQDGNDRFYVQSTSPNVDLELIGGLGSDTFDIGGAGSNIPITVVSNTLQGHSGLIAQMVSSADLTYDSLAAQWVSANVADGDAPGIVVSQVSPLVVFENQDPNLASMQQNKYSIVLTQAPTENVTVTAAPPALTEQDRLNGAENIMLAVCTDSSCTTPKAAPAAVGVTLTFTRDNWFIPQWVEVSAQDDLLAEGTRFIPIVTSVFQGSSPNDGGAYDGLPVASELVQVVDADSQSVVVTPYDLGTNKPESGLLVAENPCGTTPSTSSTCQGGDLPAKDAYQVVLSKQPGGAVTYEATTDGLTQLSLDGANWSTSVQITFTAVCPGPNCWSTPQIVQVRGVDDSIAQGLHFSRITQGLSAATDPGLLFGITADDVAAGLASAVDGDPTGRVRATACGSTITIGGSACGETILGGPALTFTASASVGTITADKSSIPAYEGAMTLTLGGTPVAGDIWSIRLNGVDIGYGVQSHTVSGVPTTDSLSTVAQQLAATITAAGLFTATWSSSSPDALTITPNGLSPYTVSLDITNPGNATPGTGTATPNILPNSTTAYAKLVLDVSVSSTIELNDSWVLSLNAGSTSASAVSYTFVAGEHGETSLIAPIDVQVADDEAPGVLVLQPSGSTNVIEPSSFIVLGDGFVTSVLSSCTSADATCSFKGDFGSSEVNEIAYHATLDTAQNLDSGDWGMNADPDILNATTVPHITVHGTGDGNDDWYKFTIASGTAQVTLDMDNGYQFGDPILWLSKLKLYDASGDLIQQGPGYSDPSVGAGGSSTWYDDFLQTGQLPAGTYYVDVGSWLLTTGLPVGVSYDLQVSVENHPIAGFVFAPQPVSEDETGNNSGTGQSVDDPTDWYTFFNNLIGNTAAGGGSLCSPACGAINSQTPYAQITGSGDGSFDLYSFTVTPDMLNPPSSTIDPSSTTATGPFYASVGLVLNGAVHVGDTWKLGIGNQVLTYPVIHPTDGLDDVAAGLGGQLGSGFTYQVVDLAGGGVELDIQNKAGFTLSGVNGTGPTVNGVMQLGSSEDRITRTTVATQADGSTPIDFSSATVTFGGTPTAGDTWTIRVGGIAYDHLVTSTDDLTSIAIALAGLIPGATPSGDSVTITDAGGFTLSVEFKGVSPAGTATITGTPLSGEASSVVWTTSHVTLPTTVQAGDAWTITLQDGSGTVSSTQAGTTGSALATAFADRPEPR